MEQLDLVIIGTGPGGLTAAIYASRANLKLKVIEGNEPGGQLTSTTDVENFPGFPNGVTGPELMQNMKEQASRFGAEFISSTVETADLAKRPFTINCSNGEKLQAKAVIIATGASARYLGLPNEKALIGKGVSACATCDGFFYRNKIIHVVGGGDTAMEEATFLTKFAKKVYVIHRRDSLRASKAMQQRAFDNPKIEFIWDSTVKEILSDNNGVTGLILQNLKTQEENKRETDGLFLAIGHTPNTKFLGDQVELNSNGFIKTQNTKTNIPGVFACGDVQDPDYRQAISAAGSGCIAAIRTERFLSEN